MEPWPEQIRSQVEVREHRVRFVPENTWELGSERSEIVPISVENGNIPPVELHCLYYQQREVPTMVGGNPEDHFRRDRGDSV
jgi:hypothetical protein